MYFNFLGWINSSSTIQHFTNSQVICKSSEEAEGEREKELWQIQRQIEINFYSGSKVNCY